LKLKRPVRRGRKVGDESHQREIQTPDTTRLQLVAVAQAVLAVAIAFGVPINEKQSIALVALAGVIGAALVTADAAIRRERARNADKLRPGMGVTQSDELASQRTTAAVAVPSDAYDGEAGYAHLMELLAALEKIRAALQASPSALVRNDERVSAISPR
jgi:hypothetical protein